MAIQKYKDADGNWQELNVKVMDTLPLGSIVEYDGITVPDGWERVSDYSTNEIKTESTWIDGKPIYRKVIVSTTFTTNFYSIGSNIDTFIIQYGYVQRKDYPDIWNYIPSKMSGDLDVSFLANNRNDGIQIEWGNSWKENYNTIFNKIILIVEYTKTTDTPVSTVSTESEVG